MSGIFFFVSFALFVVRSWPSAPTKKPRCSRGSFANGKSRQACCGSIVTVDLLFGPCLEYFTVPVIFANSV
jgi:hypothetical protein